MHGAWGGEHVRARHVSGDATGADVVAADSAGRRRQPSEEGLGPATTQHEDAGGTEERDADEREREGVDTGARELLGISIG